MAVQMDGLRAANQREFRERAKTQQLLEHREIHGARSQCVANPRGFRDTARTKQLWDNAKTAPVPRRLGGCKLFGLLFGLAATRFRHD